MVAVVIAQLQLLAALRQLGLESALQSVAAWGLDLGWESALAAVLRMRNLCQRE